jgi:hypothetical protein
MFISRLPMDIIEFLNWTSTAAFEKVWEVAAAMTPRSWTTCSVAFDLVVPEAKSEMKGHAWKTKT